ncbi:hypothetical protein BBK14_26890 [Parafrankia soli]|uniref:DUF2804 domain-containing protein n=1 Tax=Parafrankia soli TaxID=2599596 RepID=A0A1S1PI07_9ACTN|nr:hypothetical protein BBK14_26890 [Parafrankia soli]
MNTPIDLTGGLDDEREFFLAAQPDDLELRDSASFWVYDDAGFVTLPRFGIEAIASKWDSHQYQANVAFADGRVFRVRDKGARHSPIGSDGRPSVLGAGPLEFRTVEPFRRLTASFEGEAVKTSTAALLAGNGDGPRVAVEFHVEAVPVVPPWINGALSSNAAEVLASSIEGAFLGGARYEQLVRAEGFVRVEGEEHRFTGTGTRVRRQGHREMAGFWGHCQQSAVFPSGRGFGYIAHRPRPDGEGSYNEGYVFTGDGSLVPARVVRAPWLTTLQGGTEDVSLVLESEIGTIEIGGETVTSVFNLGDPTSPNALAALVQGGVRYTWDGEEAYGAIERSTPPRELVRL